MNTPASPWRPLAPSRELRAGDNIVAAFVDGAELALWRSSDGRAQVWDNRCPHRSVRLTLGRVTGNSLQCAYHGWRYAAGSGECDGIPAHPAMNPPRNVCVQAFPVAEAAGMVWTRLDTADAPPPPHDVVPAGWHYARALTVRAPLSAVQETLRRLDFTPGAESSWKGALDGVPVVALLLHAKPGLSFVHLWTEAAPGSPAMQALQVAARVLRDEAESLSPAPGT